MKKNWKNEDTFRHFDKRYTLPLGTHVNFGRLEFLPWNKRNELTNYQARWLPIPLYCGETNSLEHMNGQFHSVPLQLRDVRGLMLGAPNPNHAHLIQSSASDFGVCEPPDQSPRFVRALTSSRTSAILLIVSSGKSLKAGTLSKEETYIKAAEEKLFRCFSLRHRWHACCFNENE